MEKKGYKHPGKKRMVVAVNPDGSVAEVFEYIKDAVAKYGMDRHSLTPKKKRTSPSTCGRPPDRWMIFGYEC